MTEWNTTAVKPPEREVCLVLLENRDIVVAVACGSWETGFFTTRAMKPKRGVSQRSLNKLPAPAVLWRPLGELPDGCAFTHSGLVLKELARSVAEDLGDDQPKPEAVSP